ncbi:hypothetical protein [Paracoccus sp. S1E-3]|uniref:hypothetical protein n=1 Tax=Paracoccus sp. S1E-3 TaxID=2756130 RepID=UPI0015EFB04A|nr:hypothetical protein [Paracoccus sp. S1E-3]MBA4492293.1 hypothetical protein [Paracoccus sp. S1E-3]
MAAESLIAGDADAALNYLERAGARLERSPDATRSGVRKRLARLEGLARAAADGIADARALISIAGASARNVTTYDRRGEPNKVRVTRPTLGRF